MCGRFTLRVSVELIAGEFLLILRDPLPPRYNIAPSQAILAIVVPTSRLGETEPIQTDQPHSFRSESRARGKPSAITQQDAIPRDGLTPAGSPARQLVWMQWGFSQSGRPTGETSSLLVNLRAETALENPRFRRLLEANRCLILADGFYEWEKIGRNREPFFIDRKDDRPFGMAGLWKPPSSAQPEKLPECVVLTTPANAVVQPIHDRMPALLLPEHYSVWLDPAYRAAEQLAATLQPYPQEFLEAYPVSERVNSAEYDQPDCIQRQNRPLQRRLFDSKEE